MRKESEKPEAGAQAGMPEKQDAMKPKVKDTLFTKLYSEKRALLDLYQFLHQEDTSEHTEDDIRLVTLENAILARPYNDVAFTVGDRLMILVEHQSTVNENMPLRMLLYVAREYEKVLEQLKKKLYQPGMVRIPKPEFYVVYAGKGAWGCKELKLSDMYGGGEPRALELSVRVIREEEAARNYSLGGYYELIRYLSEHSADGKISAEGIHEFMEGYRNDPAGSEVFKEFLAKVQAEEVISMYTLEYNAEEEKQAIAEWAREEGMQKGMQQGMQQGMQKGMQQGREEGVRNLVLVLKPHESAVTIKERLMALYDLTEAEARAKVEKYL